MKREPVLTSLQWEVYQAVPETYQKPKTGRMISELLGYDHSIGSVTHWIRPQLVALIKKGAIKKTKTKDRFGRVKNLYRKSYLKAKVKDK